MGYVWNGKQGMDLTLNNGKRVIVTLMDIEGARAALKQHGVMLHETI
jgi:hypothetical protein